ncbi:TPA: transferrin-binding protein-like solute binding protein [Neisseria meningitidis]|uniref:Transferrin-binding protein B n=1 Tax=Neisseria meningitidis serogroup A / serotype 4A (strain DSM 15465 / Z2491) TaxID=122587 RepID=A0A0U1RJK9_NEIMA|nr:transferrin-binding protein-like solute binding protein [Neisseria meningitidis]EJU77774.1 lactoferrin-binding protein [Neisseria meningitidis NM3081]ELK70811.1 transferrin binding -like solute binding family protein [Neisseria meningitidis 63041]ELL11493.1 transferrin binding -like solute binding family protein [Neisseria meningitidis 65014]ELL31567.1 transferrin binding -like solute binding family protein [Neisseria meningitidis 63006]EOB66666.1 transferrin binding -like solute binding fa
MCKPNYGGIVLLPLLLASCIGGNFGVQPVVESTPTAYPVTFKSKDVPTSPPAGPSVETTPVNRPAVGAAMRLLRRNIAFHREDGTAIPDSKQAEEKLSFKEGDVLFLYGSKKDKLQQLKDKIHQRNPNVEIRTSENENKKYGYEFVDAGYVYTTKGKDEIEWTSNHKQFTYRFGYDGFVYYSGEHPSQSLPSAGTVKYSGNWQYMTDAIRHRTGKAGDPSEDLGYIVYYGQNVGATSYAATADDREGKHPAEYTVDFGKKTLTGKLIKNQYVQKKTDEKKPLTIYDITATLDGNRFTGSAKVNTEVKTKHADKEHLFFHTDADQRLEGGFFGDNGEELAGRFISNDNSVFGVFAGKQKTDASNASDTNPAMPSEKHTKILDSLKISVDEATDSNARKFAISPMPDFGHPDKLLVEGREISLLKDTQTIDLADGRKMTVSACCDFLTYVKLGRIKTDRPASKPKAEDENSEDEIGESEENEEDLVAEEENTEDEVVEDEDREEDEVSEDGNSEDEEEIAEEDDDEAEEEEVEEPEEESPEEGGGGGSDGIPPASEAPKGRDIDLFLKGIRTAEADIPQTGKARYTGTWEARISKPIQWDNKADKKAAKAEFDVDFGEKSISGTLTEKNGVEAAFYIEKGVIDGNGFHATARTRDNGINLSGNGSTNPKTFQASDLRVEGGFYGPQAEELGGTIFNKDGKSLDITEDIDNEIEADAGEQLEPEVKPQFGVVFGAKKDMQEVEK